MASENPDDKKGIDPIRDWWDKPQKLYKGVYENKGNGKWYAQTSNRNKKIYIGTFGTELEAALAYDKACRGLNRAEGTLNFPNLQTQSNSPNPSSSGVQISGPSGSSGANVRKGKERKYGVTVSQSEIDAARPFYEAKKKRFEDGMKGNEATMNQLIRSLPNPSQPHTGAASFPANKSTLPSATSLVTCGLAIGSGSANVSGVHPTVMGSVVSAGVEFQDLKNGPTSQLSTEADKIYVHNLLDSESSEAEPFLTEADKIFIEHLLDGKSSDEEKSS